MEFVFSKVIIKIMGKTRAVREGREGGRQELRFWLAILAYSSVWNTGVQKQSPRCIYHIFMEML